MFKNLQKDINNNQLKNGYKTFKNKLNSLIRKSKLECYKNEIDDTYSNL